MVFAWLRHEHHVIYIYFNISFDELKLMGKVSGGTMCSLYRFLGWIHLRDSRIHEPLLLAFFSLSCFLALGWLFPPHSAFWAQLSPFIVQPTMPFYLLWSFGYQLTFVYHFSYSLLLPLNLPHILSGYMVDVNCSCMNRESILTCLIVFVSFEMSS